MTGKKTIHIITGLSGAGKSLASHCLEDLGYYCVDNLPPELIEQFVELATSGVSGRDQIALVCDARGGDKFEDLFLAFERLAKKGIHHFIIFLEARDEVLIRRFSETRRAHPLRAGTLSECIRKERDLLEEVRGNAAAIVDTSDLSPTELRKKISDLVQDTLSRKSLQVAVTSFGFKYGVPAESDLVFDARFLPNPYYVPSLSPLTGRDEAVSTYIFKWEVSRQFLNEIFRFVDFCLPQFVKEGKSNLTISIGCTGGRHRSVALAEELKRHVVGLGLDAIVRHRDVGRVKAKQE